MSYPGTRIDLFDNNGKGPMLRRDIHHTATAALYGVVRLVTAQEAASGALSGGGPAVFDMSTMSGNVLQPIKNLQTSLNNEIAARGNGDSNLQNQISSLQGQIGQGQAVYYTFNYNVVSGNYITIPAGGTWMVWKPVMQFQYDVVNPDNGMTEENATWGLAGPTLYAGGSTIHVYHKPPAGNMLDYPYFMYAIRTSVYQL